MKRGFTLVELIGVIIIVVLLCLLAIPPILNSINSTKNEVSDAMKEILTNASELYVSDNAKKFPERDGNVYCVQIQKLIDEEYLSSPLLDPVTKKQIPASHYAKIEVNAGVYNYDFAETCEASINSLMVGNYATTYGESNFLGKVIYREYFESITIVDNSQVPANAIDSWDVSAKQNGSIKAWYLDIDSNGLYELYIGQDGGVVANPNSSSLFMSFTNVKSINLTHLDTSNVTNMNYMFAEMWGLDNIDLTTFNTSNVTDMSSMFSGTWTLTSLDLTTFNTSNVTDMSSMFNRVSSLTSLDLTTFNTSNVTDMSSMFSEMGSLTSLDLTSFNTSNVTDMSYMFYGMSGLTSLDLTPLNTSKVTDMRSMFYSMYSLTTLKLNNADFSNVKNYSSMFKSTPISTIYVKNATAQSFINARLSEAGVTASVIVG